MLNAVAVDIVLRERLFFLLKLSLGSVSLSSHYHKMGRGSTAAHKKKKYDLEGDASDLDSYCGGLRYRC
jgi:hypothetical protein